MAAPFALTYEAPVQALPDWLSYRLTPTATVVQDFTVATLAPNGAATLETGLVTLTRYTTELLELPVTIDLPAVASGQQQVDLGPGYTTAGGDGPTVARVYGQTDLVTLAGSPTGGANSATRTSRESAESHYSSIIITFRSSRQSALSSATVSTPSSSPPRSSAPSPSSSSSSASSFASSSSSPTSSTLSTNGPNNSTASALDRAARLTPSQLAAAIAAPIAFFFLVIFLLWLGCCLYRKRKRDRSFEGVSGGGIWGSGGRGGGYDAANDEWDWVQPREGTPQYARSNLSSRLGGFFAPPVGMAASSRDARSRSTTPLRNDSRQAGAEMSENRAGGGGPSLLAGRSPRDTDEDPGEVGASMLAVGRGGNRWKPPTGLGVAGRGGPANEASLPERAAATISAGLRSLSGGKLGGSPRPNSDARDYAYSAVGQHPSDGSPELDLPDTQAPPYAGLVSNWTAPTHWDPYRPSPVTPEFPVLAPSSSTSSGTGLGQDDPRDVTHASEGSTSPDDVRRANRGLADLAREGGWTSRSAEGSSAAGHDDGCSDADDDENDGQHDEPESEEMLASQGPYRDPPDEPSWFRGSNRPDPARLAPTSAPPLIRIPSDPSISQYSQSDAGGRVSGGGRGASGSGMWLPPPAQTRARENSGGSVASVATDFSMGKDKLSVADLFFNTPLWTGARNPTAFQTSHISPVFASETGHLTPPESVHSARSDHDGEAGGFAHPRSPVIESSPGSSRYADAPSPTPTEPLPASPALGSGSGSGSAPVSRPASEPRTGSIHTPNMASRDSGTFPDSASYQESPMVYPVMPTPTSRLIGRTRQGARDGRPSGGGVKPGSRPGSGEALDRIAKSFEKARGGRPDKREAVLYTGMGDVRFEPEVDRPFSNLTPVTSPLLPAPPSPPSPPRMPPPFPAEFRPLPLSSRSPSRERRFP
ncbi:hypothetical protein JCM10212_003463 [Sporobolomyces blumeae]